MKVAFKLLRKRSDGSLGPLFVGRRKRLSPGVTYTAERGLPHPGLAHRPGFHCTALPSAPHIRLRLKNGECRVWCMVLISGKIERLARPDCQGGLWYVSEKMRIVKELYG